MGARAYQNPIRGALLGPYRQKPLLWVDVEVTNTSASTMHDVELWVTDVARRGEWDKDKGERKQTNQGYYYSGEPWSPIPLAWATGQTTINIPPGQPRTAQLLYCTDDRGWFVLLKGATGIPHRFVIGALRVELEVSSPDSATVNKALSIRVTRSRREQKNVELNKSEPTAVKDAYRRCKEILNEPVQPWHRITDLRNVPRRVAFTPVKPQTMTAYDKIADAFIADNKELNDLPVRREAKRRREAAIDPRVKKLEELRLEVGEDVWPILLTYFPIYETPARIQVES